MFHLDLEKNTQDEIQLEFIIVRGNTNSIEADKLNYNQISF